VQFAVSAPNAGDPAALIALACDAEAAGWDAFFLWDHLQLFRAMQLDLHDPWVLLGAVAGRTERLRLGTLVTPLPRRRPQKLAKEIVTLDHLSGGRVVVGLGLGFPDDDEFTAFGEDADRRVRADRLDEGLVVLDQLLRGVAVEHRGTHHQVDAQLRPAARQSPRPPFWLACMAPYRRPLRRASRWDGVAPISADGTPMRPEDLAAYLATEWPSAKATGAALGEARAGGGRADVVTARAPDTSVADYAAAGATWLVESTWPEGDWLLELRQRVRAGPPTA
jgi:alkanesulfonate monooxygenase SsuD/methylene tetrahydromethanopterin reductase-like flavin-dependent oxidoreductase (luciferase family)